MHWDTLAVLGALAVIVILAALHGLEMGIPTLWENMLSFGAFGVIIALMVLQNSKRSRIDKAIRRGDIDALARMQASGVDLFASRAGYSGLHEAARSGPPESLEFLLKHVPPGQIDSKDAVQGAPLHHAVALGRVDCVRILLDAGADPNLEDSSPWRFTPIRLALINNYPDIAELLHERGAWR